MECEIVTMEGWRPARGPGYGWPLGERAWVNPSPNAPNLWMARCFPGTVMFEGTTLPYLTLVTSDPPFRADGSLVVRAALVERNEVPV